MKNKNKLMDVNNENRAAYSGRNLLSGALFGIGFAAFIDETVFHQILHWHHFYDKSTTEMGLISDGLFHAFSWFATVGGLFLVADLRRRHALWHMKWWGGKLLGAGGFQLYDGIIQHKLMKLHQIRYVDNLYIYDLVWNVLAALMILGGLFLVFRAKDDKQPRKAELHGHS